MNQLNNLFTNLPYNDIFSNISTSLSTLTGKIQGISLTVIILAFVIIGVMFVMGESMSQKAKSWLMYILIGAFFIFGAATFGSTLQDVAGF